MNELKTNAASIRQGSIACWVREHADFSGDSTLLARQEMRFPYRPLGAHQKALPSQV